MLVRARGHRSDRADGEVGQLARLFWLVAMGMTLGLLSACGSSSDESADASVDTTAAVDTEGAAPEADVADEADATEASSSTGADEESVVDDCDFSEFVYTEFAEVPADWPATFPRPEGLVEVGGDVGVGCERQTVDMRSRYYGNDGRDWMTAYGEQLEAAGFELADDDDQYEAMAQWYRTFRRGQDVISYGGDFELVGADGEYLSLGITLTDFPD